MNRRDLFKRALGLVGLGALGKAKTHEHRWKCVEAQAVAVWECECGARRTDPELFSDFENTWPETPYIWPEEKAPGESPYSLPVFVNVFGPPTIFSPRQGLE